VEKRGDHRARQRHDVGVTNDLGASGAPPAVRASAPGWRDPRLWIGVAIVAVSVVAGARLVESADDSVTVWATSSDLGPGDAVGAGDLTAHRVRFVDDGDLDRYFPADEELPADLRLERAVAEGELLPRSAVGTSGESDAMELPVAVDSALVPPAVESGWVVDVYLTGAPAAETGAVEAGDGRPVLSEVTVVDAPPVGESFAVSGQRQLVLGVTDAEARRFFRVTGSFDAPALTIVRRG
jgi:hypothetical protein